MARDSKGQQVKTFKHFVPLANLKYEETTGKVYFKADDGCFYVYLPDHITAVARALPDADGWYETKGARRHGSAVFAPTMDAAMKSYDCTLKAYRKLIENQQREKVIKVEFKHNIRWIKEFHQPRNIQHAISAYQQQLRDGISFCGSPAIHLRYEVLYRVGNDLYRVDFEGTESESLHHHQSNSANDSNVIPWTPEAEAFFANTVANIERLIMAMIEFFDDTPANLALAIANGGTLKLPAPPATPTEKE